MLHHVPKPVNVFKRKAANTFMASWKLDSCTLGGHENGCTRRQLYSSASALENNISICIDAKFCWECSFWFGLFRNPQEPLKAGADTYRGHNSRVQHRIHMSCRTQAGLFMSGMNYAFLQTIGELLKAASKQAREICNICLKIIRLDYWKFKEKSKT